MSGIRSVGVTDLGQFTCAVCMEIFLNPVRVSCGHNHVFCRQCVDGMQSMSQELQCPQCRNPFQRHQCMPANDVQILMKSAYGMCSTCATQMSVPELRTHMERCVEKASASAKYQFKPVRQTAQPIPQPGPNRSTFRCPYCSQANLDCKAMIEHCNTHHRRERSQVVCPICASMPWGDPNLLSSNFLQHLNTRHKFEYETYVDYEQDDDAMLRAALEASLQQK